MEDVRSSAARVRGLRTAKSAVTRVTRRREELESTWKKCASANGARKPDHQLPSPYRDALPQPVPQHLKRRRAHDAEDSTTGSDTHKKAKAVEDLFNASGRSTSQVDADPIAFWSTHGEWPPGFAERAAEMSDQLISQKRSYSSYSQSVRDGDNPPAFTQQHEQDMEQAGLFMNTASGDINACSKELCNEILTAKCELPSTQFERSGLLDLLPEAQCSNEARVFPDVTPLLVPSPALLRADAKRRDAKKDISGNGNADNGNAEECDAEKASNEARDTEKCDAVHDDAIPSVAHKDEIIHDDAVRKEIDEDDAEKHAAHTLQHISESINAEWTQSATLCGPKPKPDFAVGIALRAFTDTQKSLLKQLHTAHCPNLFPQNMYYPFLICEVKGRERTLREAERQSMHGASIAANAIIELYKKLSQENKLYDELLTFSVSHNDTMVKIHGHFVKLQKDKLTFHRCEIFHSDYSKDFEDDSEKWGKSFQIVRGIYLNFFPKHFSRITFALEQLQADKDEEGGLSGSTSSWQSGNGFKKPAMPPSAKLQRENERLREQIQELTSTLDRQLTQQKEMMERQIVRREEIMERHMTRQKEMMERQIQMMESQLAQQKEEQREQKQVMERQTQIMERQIQIMEYRLAQQQEQR